MQQVKPLSGGAKGKPRVKSPREAQASAERQVLHVIDPKPGDLSMSRLK